MKRPGNNPKRRIAPPDQLTDAQRTELARVVRYAGSGHHKRYPADYGLERTNPRPNKSLCDLVKVVPLEEAKAMLHKGVLCGMFSSVFFDEHPKYIWCVSDDGEVYEAKTDPATPGVYHGYPLQKNDEMRDLIKTVWKQRCPQAGP
jgi:hypothetical protein